MDESTIELWTLLEQRYSITWLQSAKYIHRSLAEWQKNVRQLCNVLVNKKTDSVNVIILMLLVMYVPFELNESFYITVSFTFFWQEIFVI